MVVIHEISEGASSSSSTHCRGYDIFLSFRGLDTRHGFTDHLYKALIYSRIATFLDDEDIETGEDLKPNLESAIKESRASVIVLSKNYATSTWCLDELVLILEERKTSDHVVIPIFYHVEPTHIRKQQSSFKDAMDKHRQRMEAETDANKKSKLAQKMEKWKNALEEVADLKGMEVKDKSEVEFIDKIVKDIFRRLRISSRFPLPQLIGNGMDKSIRFITSWLKEEPSDTTPDIITIFGMGGIGKTSLAKYVYALHFHEFEKSSFIEDITRKCDEKYNGMLDVQKQLYEDIHKPSSVQIYDVPTYTSMIENIVAGKKLFLVLDAISSFHQLDALLGNKGFHRGSKILITTRDTSLTERCALFKTDVKPKHATHTLKVLSKTESEKLLYLRAFMCNDPKPGYEEVSENILEYCKGHPMALDSLGRYLYGHDVTYWEEELNKLKKENSSPVNSVLRMSFNSLPSENDKQLFKHIACIFVGMDRDFCVTILEACDILTRSGITNLIDRGLLSIGRNNEMMMHELVQEMGRFVVCEESPKPWKRSRLWGNESFTVLKDEKGTDSVLGLTLDVRMLEKEKLHGSLELKTNALNKMYHLMLLQLNYVQITGSYKNFPKKLVWLCMHGFPLKYVPSELPMENLVALDMSYSKIESFDICYSYPQQLHKMVKEWVGSGSEYKRLLRSLKILNLSFCEQLRSLRGFDHLPKLQMLILKGCVGLLEVCESIEQCDELDLVDLSYCNKLGWKLPKIVGMLKKIKKLLLKGCNLGTQISSSTALQAFPNYSKFFVTSLPRYLVHLSLQNNNLSTESFPMDFSCLCMLKELYLDGNPIVSLPSCVRSLPRLETLSMSNCEMLTIVEHPPHTLKYLNLYFSSKPLLWKVVFDPQMSPLHFMVSLGPRILALSSFEFEGMVKIEPLEVVEEKVLHNLGWTKQDFVYIKRVFTSVFGKSEESEIQMYYEFGIFSTLYLGKEMPNWIKDRSTGPSISFTIPSSPNKLRGLNFCCVLTSPLNVPDGFSYVPVIRISNITKNLTWIYDHYIDGVLNVGGQCFTFLSHWMFGMNEMECGDQVTITITKKKRLYDIAIAVTKECGVSFVYDDGENKEEEDVLGYYKSWNHIIGGDLTGFQTTTGEYILHTLRFMEHGIEVEQDFHELVDGAFYKDKQAHFRALSQRKPGVPEDSP